MVEDNVVRTGEIGGPAYCAQTRWLAVCKATNPAMS